MVEIDPEIVKKFAHDVKSPLTSLGILVHTLKKDLPPARKEDLKVMQEELDRIDLMVNSLRDKVIT
ncbi:histidine kinase dimerization/phospho-acceptor domain-containing protein [Candidatus Margulisiibacteriota bacterium]